MRDEHDRNSIPAMHQPKSLSDNASKINGSAWGSIGTMSTSSQASSSILAKNEYENPHCVRLDLTSIDNSDSCEEITLFGHARVASYSDISSDGSGYYDRLAQHCQRSREARCSIENSLLTLNNLKLLCSFALWFVSYMIMGVFGGSVAYLHFARSDRDVPDPLPDFGYDVIPYWCPQLPHVPHGNVQSVVLLTLYSFLLLGVVLRWNPRHRTTSNAIMCDGDGRLILQHLFHLNCLVFLTRTTTVGLTGLPQPNPKCVNQQHLPVTFINAVKFVMGRGFPPHSCGDLIYSGHVGCTLICMAVLHRHGFLRNRSVAAFVWLVAVIGIYFTISCRSHYSVDVMLAFYFGYFLPEWYFNRSDGKVEGRISTWIQSLEIQPEKWTETEIQSTKLVGGAAGQWTETPDELVQGKGNATAVDEYTALI